MALSQTNLKTGLEMVSRDVDALLKVPDAQIALEDAKYLEKNNTKELLSDLMANLCTKQPVDPIQYMIDSVNYGPEYAHQDDTGLPEHRKEKLMMVFSKMDEAGVGKVSFRGLQSFVSKFGGQSLSEDELSTIFSDFNPSAPSAAEHMITQAEFLKFFSKVSQTINNRAFSDLIADLLL